MKHVWFVTGSSRGFGRALVHAALDAGDLVAATARRPGQLADLIAEHGDSICPSRSTSPTRPPPARRSPRPASASAGWT